MRQRKRKWAQPYLDANEKYVIKDFPVTESLFYDQKPIHMDIGPGQGDFPVLRCGYRNRRYLAADPGASE